jgi:hypothetical protein
MVEDTPSPEIDLAQWLCLEAGRLMEDASVELALAWPAASADRGLRISRLRQTSADIAALGAAAEILHRRSNTDVS